MSLAALKGHETVVDLLLATNHADIKSKDDKGQTPLLLASRRGYDNVMKLLLSIGTVDVNCTDNDGQTPLLTAILGDKKTVCELLLATDNVDVNSEDNDGWTAISLAASRGQVIEEKGHHSSDRGGTKSTSHSRARCGPCASALETSNVKSLT